jgi:hypothetical protein
MHCKPAMLLESSDEETVGCLRSAPRCNNTYPMLDNADAIVVAMGGPDAAGEQTQALS